VTELTATMGYYAMLACVLNAFEVLPDEETPLGSG
jgi:4-carboxymuconolactone decarboxylase